MESVKITALELENVKRIRAVQIEPSEDGLTIIGGNNNQGKTSVLDAIAWALGGSKYKQPARDGSAIPPRLKITMSNGIVVERTGKNSSLKVTDPSGRMAGQQLLNSFVEELALNLPRFMQASSKDKADTLLRVIGVGDKVYELERQETDLYNQRRAVGQVRDSKLKHWQELPEYAGVPADLQNVSDFMEERQRLAEHNHTIASKEEDLKRIRASQVSLNSQIAATMTDIRSTEKRLEELKASLANIQAMYQGEEQRAMQINKELRGMNPEPLDDIDAQISEIEETNRKVRANLDKEKAKGDADEFDRQYWKLSADLESVRSEKKALLDCASLPLQGLTVEQGELLYNGYRWDQMSGSDQLKVSTAIVRALKPQCGFVLMDKLEQMDVNTLAEFGAWLKSEHLQVIATRVSTGGECSIIIEDGYSKTPGQPGFFDVGGEW